GQGGAGVRPARRLRQEAPHAWHGAGDERARAPARRAVRGPDPGRDRRHDRADQADAGPRASGRVHRTRDAGAHVAGRPRPRHAPRRDVLRGHPAGDARRRAGDRGVPGIPAPQGRCPVTTPILAVSDLSAGYGDAPVIHGLGVTVEHGEAAVIIGPNGHGKTTFLRAVSGLLKPSGGEVLLDGEPVAGRTPEYISGLGLVHIPQGDGLFAEMTVEENLLMGAFPGSAWRDRRRSLAPAHELFPRLPGP